jgi:hypothetical protein
MIKYYIDENGNKLVDLILIVNEDLTIPIVTNSYPDFNIGCPTDFSIKDEE